MMMGKQPQVAFLGNWSKGQMRRADEMVAILARLNVDVACLIHTDWGGLDVITQQEMHSNHGREHLLLADKYKTLVRQRVGC